MQQLARRDMHADMLKYMYSIQHPDVYNGIYIDLRRLYSHGCTWPDIHGLQRLCVHETLS